MQYVVVEVTQESGQLQRERVLVPHPSVADAVDDHGRVPGRRERALKIREDPLDGAVARRRDGLDPPSDENDPHTLPTFAWD